MPRIRSAMLLFALAAASVAAPLPFEQKGKRAADSIPALLAHLARSGEVDIPELSAHLKAESVRGRTLHRMVIKVYDAAADHTQIVRAEECELHFDRGSSRLVLHARDGWSYSIRPGPVTSMQVWDERTLEFPWRPAAK